MKRAILIASHAVSLALLSHNVDAADFPKSGTTKATGYLTWRNLRVHEAWADGTAFKPDIVESTGVIVNETPGGPFDGNYVSCIAHEMPTDGYTTEGSCVEKDKDGDMAFLTFAAATFTYVGGTGKYKGLTGGGTIQADALWQAGSDGAFIAHYEKTWTIK